MDWNTCLWCLVLGLFISNVIGVPAWLKPAVKTEFYIKTGLVILGSGILFMEIIQAGAYGIVQAILVVARHLVFHLLGLQEVWHGR